MFYIGIDPGVGGGIAVLRADGQIVDVFKMPATEVDLLNALRPFGGGPVAGRQACAMLEKAQPMPRQGVVSMFTYGRGYGALLMALTALWIPFDEITSPIWQAALRCRSHGNKNVTKRRAQQLFPGRTITHAIADALLLAEYNRRIHPQRGEVSHGEEGPEDQEQASTRKGDAQSGRQRAIARRVEQARRTIETRELAPAQRAAAAEPARHRAGAQRTPRSAQ